MHLRTDLPENAGYVQILCDCGCIFSHRADRKRIECPAYGKRELNG